jgi:hypothetical protein
MADFYEILFRNFAIKGDLDVIRFNPVTSTIPKWRALILLR